MLEVVLITAGVFLGVVIGDCINLGTYFKITEPSLGYRGKALAQLKWLHAVSILARAFILASLVAAFLLLPKRDSVLHGSFFFLSGIGVAALFVLLEAGFDRYLGKKATEESFRSSAIRAVSGVVFGLTLRIRQCYARNIQEMKELDNLDYQASRGDWSLGLSNDERRWRLRLIWEIYKVACANAKRNPALAKHALGVLPYQRFYPLVARLGRSGLLDTVKNPPPPPPPTHTWTGGPERRRRNGTWTDRENPESSSSFRCYDDEELLRAIERGEAES